MAAKFDIVEGDLELTALVDQITAEVAVPTYVEAAAAAAAHGDTVASAHRELAAAGDRVAAIAATHPTLSLLAGVDA